MDTYSSQSHLLKPSISAGSNHARRYSGSGGTSSSPRRQSFEMNSGNGNGNTSFVNPFKSIDENNLNSLHHQVEISYTKIIFVITLFLLSLITFVIQTETTGYLYTQLGFNEPFILLTLTHGLWWISWPLQFTFIAIYKTLNKFRIYKFQKNSNIQWKGFRKSFASSVKAQHKNIIYSAELTANENIKNYKFEFKNKNNSFKTYKEFLKSTAIKYIFFTCFKLCIVLNIAGCTWYIAMGLSSGSDVTAIYNCSAFTAYAFAIPILKEKFSYIKISSVLIALFGVFIVTYSGKSNDSNDNDTENLYPHRFLGNIIILIGAIMYGFYEVYYKKKCCPPSDEVSARRQSTFSNFTMSLIGINTWIVLVTIMIFVHISGLHHFNIPSLNETKIWLFISASCIANLLFSFAFLALMALTSPVLSSVSSLVTIVLVGIVEYFIYGTSLKISQIIGYFFVLTGFVILAYCSWNEISEEDTEDVLIDTDTESISSSLSGQQINRFDIS